MGTHKWAIKTGHYSKKKKNKKSRDKVEIRERKVGKLPTKPLALKEAIELSK